MKSNPNWEEKMEEEYGRAFVHESGHALMAVLQEIPCHGICYEKDSSKFCALIDPLPPPPDLSKKHYLFLVASSAAEQITYGDQDDDGGKSDKAAFGNPGAPPLKETINEAHAILLGKARQLKRLVSKLKAKVRNANYDLGSLPEVGMDGSNKKYAVLLSRTELEDAVHHS
jgi:hypothetical protein